MKSTLFFNNITCLDHAVVDNLGRIVGGSYHVSVYVTGTVTDDESVVVDFSSGKKRMKAIIDDHCGTVGIDHKLIYIPGYSAAVVSTHGIHSKVEATTCSTLVELPTKDLHICRVAFDGSLQSTLARDIELSLQNNMPGFEFSVTLTEKPFADNPIMFRYAHGLRDSTSHGCKNIAHGHLSFFEVLERLDTYRPSCSDCQLGDKLLREAFEQLSGTYFVYDDNVVSDTDKTVELRYSTPRGHMRAVIDKTRQPVIVLDTESTIEYLAEYLQATLMPVLQLAKVKRFHVSEGLQKGVAVTMTYDT